MLEKTIRNNVLFRKLNSLYYRYRLNRWRWQPGFIWQEATKDIDRPIFLLGTQGGGLTLVARILSRNKQVVTVTGNYKYWAGGDEMQSVLKHILPAELTWRDGCFSEFTSFNHNWLYASDASLGKYYEGKTNATPEIENTFKDILAKIINMNRPRGIKNPRFLDKSQTYTVRVGLINEVLKNCRPKFVLITRNPIAMCWRAVTKDSVISTLKTSTEKKLEIAIQHWENSMQMALLEEANADIAWWRFEDILIKPEQSIIEICKFVDIVFEREMLPQKDDTIPWGSNIDAYNLKKWHPLKVNVNELYLRDIPAWAENRVRKECLSIMKLFDYDK